MPVVSSRPCPCCRSPQSLDLFQQTFARIEEITPLDGYSVKGCIACGAVFASEVPSQDEWDSYYERASKYEFSIREESASENDRFTRLSQWLSRYVKPTSALDVGCGAGGLLRRLKASGFESTGLDPSPVCAAHLKTLGIGSFSGSIFTTDVGGPYGLVTLSHVLEHVVDVDRAIETLTRRVQPNGHLYIEVPNITAFTECLDVPFQQFSLEHVNYFSAHALMRLFARHGFVAEHAWTPYWLSPEGLPDPAVGVLLRKTSSTGAVPYSPDIDSAQRYIARSLRWEGAFLRSLEQQKVNEGTLYAWGAGTQLLRLMTTPFFKQISLKGIVDRNANYKGRSISGRPVLQPDADFEANAKILVTSNRFAASIAADLRARGRNNLVVTGAYPTV